MNARWLIIRWIFWLATYVAAIAVLSFWIPLWIAICLVAFFPRIFEAHEAIYYWLIRRFKPQELSDILIGENPFLTITHPE